MAKEIGSLNVVVGLDGVMMLAATSGESLASVSDIVTDALTAFGMEAKDASSFADLLASASSNSNTNVAMLGDSFKYLAPLFGSIKDVMDQLRDKFAGLSEEQQAQYAATIFGKEAMSGMLAIINATDEDYAKLTSATREYTGTAKEMADTMKNNLQGGITKLKSALEGVGIQIFEILLPHLQALVEKLQSLVEWFANLSPATQETIVKITLVATTGAVTVAGVALYKHLNQESIPEIQLFGDEVSESTKKAVGGFLELNDEATIALNQLSWSGQEVTKEIADSITGNFSQMATDIQSGLDKHHEESLGKIQGFVNNSTSLSKEEQDQILNNMQEGYESRKQKVLKSYLKMK